ncbi:MAG: sugar ABC transporter permease [Chloroflexia bacterium]|nr:sugar ABC transporter permease [Chloroflexia bacterium]
MLILPSVLVVAVVALYPLLESFRLSLTNTRLASAREPRYVGLDNYVDILSSGSPFWGALQNTLTFTVASVGLETVFGMVIALVIHSNFKGRGIVRAAMLVPWAIPTVVSASMWDWMYHDVFGIVNDLLVYRLGILDQKVAWLANPTTALPAIIAVDVWKTTPFMALLLLAGLQLIPGDVYEASTVDGASKWQQFWQITLPLIKPALLVALIFRTLDAFRVFDVIYVMKGEATETISLAVLARRELIGNSKLGEGSAIAVIIFLCIAVLVVIYTRLVRVEEQ